MQYNIHHAKTHFSQLIEKALAGEEVVIARRDTPLIALKPIRGSIKKRTSGLSKGAGKVSDDFNEELPLEILDEFEK